MKTQTLPSTREIIDVETEQTGLARQQTAAVVRAAAPEAMQEAISSYVTLQKTLDACLPDCIMRIQGRSFRKKNYWRAVATAFNLTVECADEKWENFDGDWCCDVTYRASAPNGRNAYGDGSCSFKEKKGAQGTRHNVRSHAHTRAYNRAVSNLVGFGEVSAEEVDRDNVDDERPAGMDAETLRKWLGYAMTEKGGGWTKEQIVTLLGTYNATNAAGVPEADRPAVVARLKRPPPVTDEHHASFDEKERKAFFAALTDLNVNYDDLKAYTAAHDDPKPSSMLPDQRAALLTMLRSDKGMADFRAFVSVPAK